MIARIMAGPEAGEIDTDPFGLLEGSQGAQDDGRLPYDPAVMQALQDRWSG